MSISMTPKVEQIKDEDPIKIKAEEIYIELKRRGFSLKELLNLISYLIEKITEERKRNQNRNLISV